MVLPFYFKVRSNCMKIQNFIQGANTYGTCTNGDKAILLCLIIFLQNRLILTEPVLNTPKVFLADETLFARSLAYSITEDVCREKGVSVEKAAQLKKQVEEGTYEPDPMAIARAMYDL